MAGKKSSYLQLYIFAGLNAALWWAHGPAIPHRDLAAGLVTVLLVIAAVLIPPDARRNVVLTRSPRYDRLMPVLSLSELVVFLVVPWALLLVAPPAFQGDSNNNNNSNNDTTTGDDALLAYVLASHLFIIQTQIALEPLLFVDRDRWGARFRYIVLTNAWRGVGIGTWMCRYAKIRGGLLSTQHHRFMLDGYAALALGVWLAANAATAFVWRPCLTVADSAAEAGLRTYKGAVAIITGAASGIGRELAEELADRGVRAVVLVDRQTSLAEEVAAGLRGRGVETSVHDVDVRNFAEVKRVVAETKSSYGRIDYVFNNAGILIIGPIETIGVENFDYILDVNVRGIHHGVQAAYPIMKEQGYGHIVNTSSLLGLIPGGQWAVAYSASKFAVVGLTTNLRIEAARHGICVSLFCPGTIETPIHTGGQYGKNLTGIPKAAWDAQVAKMKAMDARLCASKTLDAVARDEAIIVVPELPMMRSRLLYRLSPSLWLHMAVNKVDWRKKLQGKEMAAAEKSGSKEE